MLLSHLGGNMLATPIILVPGVQKFVGEMPYAYEATAAKRFRVDVDAALCGIEEMPVAVMGEGDIHLFTQISQRGKIIRQGPRITSWIFVQIIASIGHRQASARQLDDSRSQRHQLLKRAPGLGPSAAP